MGIAIGIVLVAATIASFVVINARVGSMARRYSDPWNFDPQSGQPIPPEQGSAHQGPHHGDGGHHGGGHHGGLSGGDGGGGHHH